MTTRWNKVSPGVERPVMVRTSDDDEMEFIAERVWYDDGDEGEWVWQALEGQKHPKCWTDGMQWGRNDEDEPSAAVTHWRELASWERAKLPKKIAAEDDE